MLRQEREHSPTGSVSRSRLPAYCAMKSTIASRMNNADALKDAIKWARDTPIELIIKSGVFADAGRKFLVVLLATHTYGKLRPEAQDSIHLHLECQ